MFCLLLHYIMTRTKKKRLHISNIIGNIPILCDLKETMRGKNNTKKNVDSYFS